MQREPFIFIYKTSKSTFYFFAAYFGNDILSHAIDKKNNDYLTSRPKILILLQLYTILYLFVCFAYTGSCKCKFQEIFYAYTRQSICFQASIKPVNMFSDINRKLQHLCFLGCSKSAAPWPDALPIALVPVQ